MAPESSNAPQPASQLDPSDRGPLAGLIGTWVGEGVDTAPGKDGKPVTTDFIEQWIVEAAPSVKLFMGYHTRSVRYVRRIYASSGLRAAHDETGYWIWVPDAGDILIRQFVIPRGITIMAGGTAAIDATDLVVSARKGSTQYGILDAPYMEPVAPTVGYDCTLRVSKDVLTYDELSDLRVHGQQFKHADRATLQRIA